MCFILRDGNQLNLHLNTLLFLIHLFVFSIECASVVNNSLVSPGYPKNYPKNAYCEYSVPIPEGLSLIINFHDFHLEKDSSCG